MYVYLYLFVCVCIYKCAYMFYNPRSDYMIFLFFFSLFSLFMYPNTTFRNRIFAYPLSSFHRIKEKNEIIHESTIFFFLTFIKDATVSRCDCSSAGSVTAWQPGQCVLCLLPG